MLALEDVSHLPSSPLAFLLRPAKVWMVVAAIFVSLGSVLAASALLYANLDHNFGPRIVLAGLTITNPYPVCGPSGGNRTVTLAGTLYNSGDRPGYADLVYRQDGREIARSHYFLRDGDSISTSKAFSVACDDPSTFTVDVSPL